MSPVRGTPAPILALPARPVLEGMVISAPMLVNPKGVLLVANLLLVASLPLEIAPAHREISAPSAATARAKTAMMPRALKREIAPSNRAPRVMMQVASAHSSPVGHTLRVAARMESVRSARAHRVTMLAASAPSNPGSTVTAVSAHPDLIVPQEIARSAPALRAAHAHHVVMPRVEIAPHRQQHLAPPLFPLRVSASPA